MSICIFLGHESIISLNYQWCLWQKILIFLSKFKWFFQIHTRTGDKAITTVCQHKIHPLIHFSLNSDKDSCKHLLCACTVQAGRITAEDGRNTKSCLCGSCILMGKDSNKQNTGVVIQCVQRRYVQKRKRKKQRKEEGDCIFRITLSRQQYVAGGIPEGFVLCS